MNQQNEKIYKRHALRLEEQMKERAEKIRQLNERNHELANKVMEYQALCMDVMGVLESGTDLYTRVSNAADGEDF